jgi:hypothetical protein
MASPPDVVIDDSHKGINETSVTAVPRHYELDGIDDEGDEYHSIKSPSYTRNDRRDMDRMGKTQELRVSKNGRRRGLAKVILEKFPTYLYLEFCGAVAEYLGDSLDASHIHTEFARLGLTLGQRNDSRPR